MGGGEMKGVGGLPLPLLSRLPLPLLFAQRLLLVPRQSDEQIDRLEVKGHWCAAELDELWELEPESSNVPSLDLDHIVRVRKRLRSQLERSKLELTTRLVQPAGELLFEVGAEVLLHGGLDPSGWALE